MKTKLKEPFPMRWGLLAIMLFSLFAIATQIQFNRVSAERLRSANVDAYLSEVLLYNLTRQSHDNCILQIEVNGKQLEIVKDMTVLFQKIADLPAIIFIDNRELEVYRDELSKEIQLINAEYFDNAKPIRTEADCTSIPDNTPIDPEKN